MECGPKQIEVEVFQDRFIQWQFASDDSHGESGAKLDSIGICQISLSISGKQFMAKARVTIDCNHCGKRTVIDLMEEMSTQRCNKCGLRLNSVNTSSQEKRRKRVSGDPMLNKYESAENASTLKRKRRYFSSRKWRILKVILLLLVFATLIVTAYIVISNPMGMHRRW